MTFARVFGAMGTIVSVESNHEIHDVEHAFDVIERRFSRYQPGSELSRVVSGELPLTQASEQLRDAYAGTIGWRTATRGAFTPHRPDGTLDLDGIVKALAIDAAGRTLHGDWTINAGGDILRSAVRAVTAGIVDPHDRSRLLLAIELRGPRRAVATSGTAERGEHIWGPAHDFVQVSVVADDIITADVLATAIASGSRETLDEVTETWDVDVITVDAAGALLATPGIGRALAA